MCKSKCSRKSSKPKDEGLECDEQHCEAAVEAQDESVEYRLEDEYRESDAERLSKR